MDGNTYAMQISAGGKQEGCRGPSRKGAWGHVKQVYSLFSSSMSLSELKTQPGMKPLPN